MIRQLLSRIGSYIVDVVAPRRCPACRRLLLDGEPELCLGCLATLPRTGYAGKATPLSEYVDNGVAPPGFCAAWFFYDHNADFAEIIRSAKFDDRPALARELGRLFAQELQSLEGEPHVSEIDVLLPVPLHWSKRLMRGYNQSHEIALGMAEVLGIAVSDNIVARKPHKTQSLQDAKKRRNNLVGKMTARYVEELDGLNVAIVDDIITTGATARECVRALSTSGARPASIGLLALARASK